MSQLYNLKSKEEQSLVSSLTSGRKKCQIELDENNTIYYSYNPSLHEIKKDRADAYNNSRKLSMKNRLTLKFAKRQAKLANQK